ncbi:TIGR03750 family conjugal transfer protein [Klebsiella aerogenes]|uniref:TIGR03750 family conjugal transfer protein n=1 Tax=Klebsiella aerogenes TaxID=548 RepID=A0AAP9U7W1_KLEAE|nr:TIGR03750 family conjugal transfer protein [Klebsiella aerogenes]QMR42921.1 TIGR03750 family conjugal transfer protein [Klebsiella aerogenes]
MQTIHFLPDRLNAEAVVFRGFTTPELGLAALSGALLGLVLTLPFVFISWLIIPSGMLLGPLFAVLLGGRIMTRLKRGKPENYIWQRLALRMSQMGMGTAGTILVNSDWSLKRRGRPS